MRIEDTSFFCMNSEILFTFQKLLPNKSLFIRELSATCKIPTTINLFLFDYRYRQMTNIMLCVTVKKHLSFAVLNDKTWI